MLKVTNQVLDEMVKAIVDEVTPEQVILFGSHASGDANVDSDIDFLVVERKTFGPKNSRREEMSRIRKALSSYRIPKDILVYSTSEVEKWRCSVNHIIARCLRKGKVLYERH